MTTIDNAGNTTDTTPPAPADGGGVAHSGGPWVLQRAHLPKLFVALHAQGYEIIAPVVRDGAIRYDAVEAVDALPLGVGDQQGPGHYRLTQRDDPALFGYAVGPDSWKRYLHPPRRPLWRAVKTQQTLRFEAPESHYPKRALLGVRPCEIAALGVLDGVFLQTPYRNDDYAARREQALIIAVNCTAPSATCFCPSMGSGPGAQGGFDLALTEVVGEGEHWFLVAAGSPRGRALLTDLPLGLANRTALAAVEGLLERATAQITRHLDRAGLGKRLQENPLHPHWENVAARCLACGNCTSVCPTCFCTTTEEQISLDGRVSERLQRWDSCFSAEFSELGGIPVRQSTQSRYRQWLTHKLSSWIDQFGCSGCVGCGRCITWCPVGIDLTAEAQALRQSEPTAGENHGGS